VGSIINFRLINNTRMQHQNLSIMTGASKIFPAPHSFAGQVWKAQGGIGGILPVPPACPKIPDAPYYDKLIDTFYKVM